MGPCRKGPLGKEGMTEDEVLRIAQIAAEKEYRHELYQKAKKEHLERLRLGEAKLGEVDSV